MVASTTDNMLIKLSTILILLNLVVAFDYDDHLSRTKFFPIAGGAYNDDPTLCLKNNYGPDAELIRTYSVLCDITNSDTCFAFTGVSHQDKVIIIGCRGTLTDEQFGVEAIDTMLKPHVEAFDLCEVSEYFFNAYNLLWGAGIRDDLSNLTKQYPDYDIWMSGHSLGAAIASLMATAISYEFPPLENKIKLINYGQPRIGDLTYAMLHNFIVPNSYRVTHHKDLIVNLPPLNPLWFFHPKTEVFYDNDMSPNSPFKICEYDEDFSCSIGKFGTSLYEHRHYYGQWVYGYGVQNCVEQV